MAIAPDNKHRVAGIELANSLALDPHTWLHAPFEVGCVLVRDVKAQALQFDEKWSFTQKNKKMSKAMKSQSPLEIIGIAMALIH